MGLQQLFFALLDGNGIAVEHEDLYQVGEGFEIELCLCISGENIRDKYTRARGLSE